MLIYGVTPSPGVLLVPLIVPLVLATALGFGVWLAALNVRYRDVGVAVPFLIQVGLFITPIIYPFSLVPDGAAAVLRAQPDGRRARAVPLDAVRRRRRSRAGSSLLPLVVVPLALVGRKPLLRRAPSATSRT